jgi:hypothetical protein
VFIEGIAFHVVWKLPLEIGVIVSKKMDGDKFKSSCSGAFESILENVAGTAVLPKTRYLNTLLA